MKPVIKGGGGGEGGEPFIATAEWLQTFQTHWTPELLEAARRYARTQARKVAIVRHVDDAYIEDLVEDIIGDTLMGVIARDYTVSILASAIRFVQLSNERCAAVFCVDGKVKWCAHSKRFRKRIKRGTPLTEDSVAWDFFQRGDLDERPQQIPAQAWFKTPKDVEIVEHAICSPKHGTTLSMLWIPEDSASILGMRT